MKALYGLLTPLIFLVASLQDQNANQGEALQLTVQPAEVGLSPQGATQVTVVARNQSDQALSEVQLTAFNDIGLQVEAEPDFGESRELSAAGTLVWTLSIKANQGLIPGKLLLRADYSTTATGSGENGPTAGVTFATLDVQLRQADPIENLAAIEVKSTLQSLDDQHTGVLYLVIQNKSGRALRLTSLEVIPPPKDLRLTLADPMLDIPLEPGDNRVVTATIATAPQVNPGKYLLVFKATFSWEAGGQPQGGSLVATHEVTVGVFGESAILQVMVLPSFLLVPGAIIMLVVQALWSMGKTKEQREEYLFKITTPLFWLAVITGSLFMARLLYPFFTDLLLNQRRSYLPGYGFDDIVYVWSFSLIVGVLVFGAYGVISRSIVLSKKLLNWLRETIFKFQPQDDPITALRKMRRQRFLYPSILLRRQPFSKNFQKVSISQGAGQPQTGYLLQPYQEARPTHWVSPRIVVLWSQEASKEAHNQIDPLLVPEGSLDYLIQVLEKWKSPEMQVRWNPIGNLIHPTQVPTESLTPGDEEFIFDVNFQQ